jgi:hypothetical protein
VQVWNVIGVMNYLQALIEKSMILQILDEEKDGNVTFTATDGYDYHGGTNVLKVLGYFSIVGLLRVHCLLGDYQSGLLDSTTLSDLPSPLRGFFFVLTCCRLRSGIWMQSNPSTKSFYIFSRPSSITNGHHSTIKC